MSESARKKNLYPSCVRKILNDARKEYNDYDLDIIRIRVNPFARVKIPKEDKPEKTEASLGKAVKENLTTPKQPARRGGRPKGR